MASLSIYIAMTVIGLTLAIYFWSRKRSCTIPGPRGWPLIGIYPSLQHAVYKDFARLAKQYGDIFCCRIGTSDVIVVSGLEIVDELYRKRRGAFNDRFNEVPDNLDMPIGFAELPYGERWKELRSFTMTTLNNRNLGDRTFEDIVNDEIARFAEHVDEEYGETAFSPRDAIFHCLGNIGINLVFGETIEYKSERILTLQQATRDQAQCMAPFHFLITPAVNVLAGLYTLSQDISRRSKLAGFKILNDCIEWIAMHENGRKKSDDSAARDFVDLFRSEVDTKKAKGNSTYFTENSLKGVTTNLMSAGMDSTPTVMMWLVFLLTKHQDIQRKLREEILTTMGRDRSPTLDDSEKMNYTRAVIHEVHRYAPIGPVGIFHMPKEDTEYNSHFIPKSAYIVTNTWGIHHDERVFRNPSIFMPERFIDITGKFVKSKHVIAFGVGNRSCPGEVVARRELFLVLTMLVQKFHLLPEEGQTPDTLPEEGDFDGVVYRPAEFKARFIPVQE